MTTTPPPRKKSYAWIVFFALLIVATLGVMIYMVRVNMALQLTFEKLEEARQRWQAHGPRDYLMTYTKRINEDPRAFKFVVKVQDGRVKEVLMDGTPLEADRLPYHSMDRLFADIERFLELDAKPNQPRTFTTAVFDPETGALRRYVRSVMATRQRVEIQVKLEDLRS